MKLSMKLKVFLLYRHIRKGVVRVLTSDIMFNQEQQLYLNAMTENKDLRELVLDLHKALRDKDSKCKCE